MKENVSIDIKSTQSSEEGRDTVEMFTVGTMDSDKNGGYQLSYEESGATGFPGDVVVLNVSGDTVVMNRMSGGKKAVSANLVIERGKRHHCYYGTPYGEFMVGITANDIRSDIGDNGGSVFLRYTVDINSGFIYENELQINVRKN
ncbi:MAG: DUF1934 domain-containing protein [Oscillospiraceae bacterium]|jgi:uncharacterized beta-barrel protein YwiB (DUF1934 family)|nr:DUF1934 domain-containing protein [Oscillospiraceae bacterium]